jgi:hypothetical protein
MVQAYLLPLFKLVDSIGESGDVGKEMVAVFGVYLKTVSNSSVVKRRDFVDPCRN